MRTMHRIFDVNNDGVISYEDFLMLEDKFEKLGLLSTKKMDEFRAVMKVSTHKSSSLHVHECLVDTLGNLGVKLG